MSEHRHSCDKFASFLRGFFCYAITAILIFQNLLIIAPSAAQASALISNDIVISQVYGGGGNSGATLRNDFIELFNRGTAPVNISGWSVQYASATGATWQKTDLTGTIEPGKYFLIQQAAGTGGTTNLPAPDVTGTIAMGGTSGKVALVTNNTLLTVSNPSGAAIKDFIGYGATANFSETAPTVNLSNTTAAVRNGGGCADTDNNSLDFQVTAPSPRNSATAANLCGVSTTNPTGTGTANPATVTTGDSVLLTVNITPGTNPTSTGLNITADLSAIGGSSAQIFSGNGNTFTFQATVAAGTTAGAKTLPVTISDAEGRTGATTINLTVQPQNPVADHVVISQVYGGGGNTGASYQNDFVELYNPTNAAVSLTGWTVQYASSTGSGWDFTKQPLGGVINPGEYYLIGLASGGTNGQQLPAANIAGEINLSGSAGKIALVGNGESLAGNCPLSDADIIDFVGYGTADCSEGSANAPNPNGNTKALFRNSNGAVDTNNNAADFTAQDAFPRRTAPIVEIGPSVLNSDPRNSGFNAPRDASITITFTEPVTVDPSWFNIACAQTGLHNDATIAVRSRSITITPNVSFANGEQCTVTIDKDLVHDVDTNDSAPNTDTLPADFTFSFLTSTGTLPPYAPDVHLTFGNPSDAVTDITVPNNYLMQKPEFALSYNRDKGTPNWVSWHLEDVWVGSLTRNDTFRPDPQVPSEWYRVLGTDYSGSGFDRGHLIPNADRDKETSSPINQATFLMTNIIPQAPDNNQGPWADLENYLRTLLNENEIYIVAGGAGVGGTGSNGAATTIVSGNVTVPAQTWKVALVIPKGDSDVSRVTAATRTIAVIMPNTQGIRNEDWRNYLTSVDAVEALTGYDFYENLPDAIENSVEAGVDGSNPPGTAGQTLTVLEDTPTTINLSAASANNQLNFTVVNAPANGTLAGAGADQIYTPSADFNGADSFTFKVSDGQRDSNVSTVAINIAEVNDAPVAVGDTKTANEDADLVFSAQELAQNDNAGASNESGQTLTVTQVAANANTNGTVTLQNNQIIYRPAANYSGAASFGYTVCDNGTTNGAADAKCADGLVNITVNAVNDAPTLASIANQTVYLGDALNVAVQGSDAETPAGQLIYSLVGTVPAGVSINGSTGAIVWKPTARQAGQIYNLTVRVTDSEDLTAQQTFTVAVAYEWSGFLPPINTSGTSNFRKGVPIPVKFRLIEESRFVITANAKLFLAKVENGVPGAEFPADPLLRPATSNTFIFDPLSWQYVLIVDTRNLSTGVYRLRVDTGDGVQRTALITLTN
jgi:DNA/RNA endonuclease G (NUC1)